MVDSSLVQFVWGSAPVRHWSPGLKCLDTIVTWILRLITQDGSIIEPVTGWKASFRAHQGIINPGKHWVQGLQGMDVLPWPIDRRRASSEKMKTPELSIDSPAALCPPCQYTLGDRQLIPWSSNHAVSKLFWRVGGWQNKKTIPQVDFYMTRVGRQ